MNAAYSTLFVALCLASVVSIPAVQSDSGCLPGWVSFEHSCYTFGRENVTWQDAVSLCKAFGGYLLEINSDAEYEWIKGQLKARKASQVWIGANDMVEEGKFRWLSNNEPVGDVPYWRPGQPNNLAAGEHCVEMVGILNYVWADEECQYLNKYACESRKCG
ncbi:hypothetical protein BsWGS_24814 [Bradybaena similaris]